MEPLKAYPKIQRMLHSLICGTSFGSERRLYDVLVTSRMLHNVCSTVAEYDRRDATHAGLLLYLDSRWTVLRESTGSSYCSPTLIGSSSLVHHRCPPSLALLAGSPYSTESLRTLDVFPPAESRPTLDDVCGTYSESRRSAHDPYPHPDALSA